MDKPRVPTIARESFDYLEGRIAALEVVFGLALKNGGDLAAAVQTVRTNALLSRDAKFVRDAEDSAARVEYINAGARDELKNLEKVPAAIQRFR